MSRFEVPQHCGLVFVSDVEDLLGINRGESYIVSNGRLVSESECLVHGCVYYIFPRVLGGKGGFGSMLRAIGAQIEKTTSREACRDLSGRRIRDVNNEKKLKDWVAKQAERQQEKEEREERRRAKRAKYLDDTPAKMNNPEYDAQYSEIMKRSEEAIVEGLARMKEGGPSSRKRKAESSTSCSALDKYDRWNMMGGLNADDLDSDSGSDSGEGSSSMPPSTSALQPENMVSSSSSSPTSSSQDGAIASSKQSATVTSSSETYDVAEGVPACKAPRLEVSGDEVSSSADEKAGEGASSGGSSRVCKVSEEAGVMKTDEEASQSHGSSSDNGATSSPVELTEPVDLDQYSAAEDLQALGMERLKVDLTRRGLKCGGSLEERAQRLFLVKGLAPDDIPAKLLAKGKGKGKSSHK